MHTLEETPVRVGSKLNIQWRFDRFSGTVKYCRSEGREYLVGIQRDTAKTAPATGSIPIAALPQKSLNSSDPPVSTVRIESPPKPQAIEPSQIPVAGLKLEAALSSRTRATMAAMPRRRIDYETNSMTRPRIRQSREFDSPRPTEIPAEQPPMKKEAGNERKPMARKWLELATWHSKREGTAESGVLSEMSHDENSKAPNNQKENPMPHVTQSAEKPPVLTAREVPAFQVELLPVEDIYRAAGVMNPRRGYSINKVVEMLQSERIRGMSTEMKQAAVLMALDAAGIQMDQVRQDAKVRQEALDSYEAGQKKLAEAVWARKAEEVVQIQAELESVKAHHLARISRNLEGVAREKATFNSWLSLKQQECQSMAEAVELCLKSPAAEPVNAAPTEVRKEKAATATAAKPI
jgi:hypothetical protein